jgi:hypothetical protein
MVIKALIRLLSYRTSMIVTVVPFLLCSSPEERKGTCPLNLVPHLLEYPLSHSKVLVIVNWTPENILERKMARRARIGGVVRPPPSHKA